MTHQPNLKILAFVGDSAEDAVNYLTEKGYPKVSQNDMPSQIEHLSKAGQHRIITHEIIDEVSYQNLQNEFPGEVLLVAVLSSNRASPQELIPQADHTISNDSKQIDTLLKKLDFTL